MKKYVLVIDDERDLCEVISDGSGIEYIQMHPVDFMDSFVILISADPGLPLQKKAVIEGIQAFLPKPFSIDLMKEVLRPAQF